MQTLATKLRMKPGLKIKTVNAPPGFKTILGALPEGVTISSKEKDPQQIHWFVKTKDEVKEQVKEIMNELADHVLLWIYFPKGSSKIQTDLTRDLGWDPLIDYDLQLLVLISFDETWSAFAMKKRSAEAKTKTAPAKNPVLEWVDPSTKTTRNPPDLVEAFQSSKKEEAFFNSLSYSHRKEYLEWIVSAKKEETRRTRIQGTIKKLGEGLKNPYGRG